MKKKSIKRHSLIVFDPQFIHRTGIEVFESLRNPITLFLETNFVFINLN